MGRHRSIRSQLALTYAGIALFAVVLLAGILLALLAAYYARAETSFLKEAASRVLDEPVPATDIPALREWIVKSAVAAQAQNATGIPLTRDNIAIETLRRVLLAFAGDPKLAKWSTPAGASTTIEGGRPLPPLPPGE